MLILQSSEVRLVNLACDCLIPKTYVLVKTDLRYAMLHGMNAVYSYIKRFWGILN